MAVNVSFKDNTKVFVEGFEKATATGLVRAGRHYHGGVQRAVAIPNSGVRRIRQRNTSRGKKGSSYTVYPNPAKVGSAPRLRTGHGRNNIVFQFSGWKTGNPWVRVGVTRNAMYMFFHEVGIGGKKRPWLIPTLLAMREILGQLAMTTAKRAMPKK